VSAESKCWFLYWISSKIDGFKNPSQKIDGIDRTHQTHANYGPGDSGRTGAWAPSEIFSMGAWLPSWEKIGSQQSQFLRNLVYLAKKIRWTPSYFLSLFWKTVKKWRKNLNWAPVLWKALIQLKNKWKNWIDF